jgi:thymidylate synthase
VKIPTIYGNDVASLWSELLMHLRYAPFSSPRGKSTKELLGVQLHLNDLQNNILVCDKRNLNYRFMVAEWLWIAQGRDDVQGVAYYNKKIAEFSDDGVKFAGAYGPRLAPQWRWLIEKFEKDQDTRQAVASIWTPNPASSKDIPCTLNLQFLYRDARLNCIVTMRSSDVWLGLPYDIFNFSMLTNSLAGELKVQPGWLQLNLGSSHWYQEHWIDPSLTAQFLRSPLLSNSWEPYYPCLKAKTSAEALEVLRCIAPL